jgi:hypothetical protein
MGESDGMSSVFAKVLRHDHSCTNPKYRVKCDEILGLEHEVYSAQERWCLQRLREETRFNRFQNRRFGFYGALHHCITGRFNEHASCVIEDEKVCM